MARAATAFVTLFLVATIPAFAGSKPTGNGLIAYTAVGDKIYFVNPDGTGRRAFRPGYAPRWSPDGSRLAFINSAGELWVVSTGGANPHRLSTGASEHSWSPNGERIAFLGRSDAGVDVYVVDVADGRTTRLTYDGGPRSPPSWAPDGTQLVFGSPTPFYTGPIVIADADGSGTRTLAGSDAVNPVWSPDGTRIAFVDWRRADPSLGRGEVYVIHPDGSGRTRLSRELMFPAWVPMWSPDGARLLVTAAREIGYSQPTGPYYPTRIGTYVVAADASDEGWLSPREEELWPAWSPDGTKIVFGWRRGRLFVANADGSCPTELKIGQAAGAAWQPVPGRAESPRLHCTDLEVRAEGATSATIALRSTVSIDLIVENISNELTPSAKVVVKLGKELRVRSARAAPAFRACAVAVREAICSLGALGPGERTRVVLEAQAVRPGKSVVHVAALGRVADPRATSNAFRLRPIVSACTIIGNSGSDLLVGKPGRDVICGRRGRDRILGRGGDDVILGGSGSDTLVGGSGNDSLSGQAGADLLVSDDEGRDRVRCGNRVDRVIADRRDWVAPDCEAVLRRLA